MIEIRPIASDDVHSVLLLARACGLSHWNEEEYRAETHRLDSIFFGAFEAEKTLCGFIVGRLVPSTNAEVGSEAEVYNIGVKKELREQGIGSKLLSLFFQRCREQEVNSVWLDVRESNRPAIEFYKKHGFAALTERKSFYRDPIEDAIVMRSII